MRFTLATPNLATSASRPSTTDGWALSASIRTANLRCSSAAVTSELVAVFMFVLSSTPIGKAYKASRRRPQARPVGRSLLCRSLIAGHSTDRPSRVDRRVVPAAEPNFRPDLSRVRIAPVRDAQRRGPVDDQAGAQPDLGKVGVAPVDPFHPAA